MKNTEASQINSGHPDREEDDTDYRREEEETTLQTKVCMDMDNRAGTVVEKEKRRRETIGGNVKGDKT